jgi:hypothetical protein
MICTGMQFQASVSTQPSKPCLAKAPAKRSMAVIGMLASAFSPSYQQTFLYQDDWGEMPYGFTVTAKRTVPEAAGARVPVRVHSMAPGEPTDGTVVTAQAVRLDGKGPTQVALW